MDIQNNIKAFQRNSDFILKNKKLQEEIMSSHALRDKDYDLVSTIYHAAYGEDLCRQYMEDAEKRATTMLLNFSKSLRKGTEPTNGQKR